MRSRQARVSSTEEIFLAASAAPSSPRVALSKLLDDLRHEVEALFHGRRDRLIKLALVCLAHRVRTETLNDSSGMRHRLDARGIDASHLVDKTEHAVQAIEHRARFLGLDCDTRQAREAKHVVGG